MRDGSLAFETYSQNSTGQTLADNFRCGRPVEIGRLPCYSVSMIRRAFGFAVALTFLASFAAPLCVAAAPAPSHSCCGGSSKKSPAGPAGSCCRQALPSSAKPAAAAPAPALAHCSPSFVAPVAVAEPVFLERRVVLGAAPPRPASLSPPARAA